MAWALSWVSLEVSRRCSGRQARSTILLASESYEHGISTNSILMTLFFRVASAIRSSVCLSASYSNSDQHDFDERVKRIRHMLMSCITIGRQVHIRELSLLTDSAAG